jgi:hypothetical protein
MLEMMATSPSSSLLLLVLIDASGHRVQARELVLFTSCHRLTQHTNFPFAPYQGIELILHLPLAHEDMANEFTLFPQLITELRLEIWRLALPEPLNKALYPYKKGCWVLEDLGTEPDPNGDDLHLRHDFSLLEPHQIDLSMYFVSREAHRVAVKYLRTQKLVISQDSAQSGLKFLRLFDPDTDTIFLPTSEVETFALELAERLFEPDLHDRNVSIPGRALPRLALTPSGLKSFMGEPLETYFDFSGTIDVLYVIDFARDNSSTLEDFKNASKHLFLELEGAPLARLIWSNSRRRWEEISHECEKFTQLKDLVEGLDEPSSFVDDNFHLEVQLVHVATRGNASSATTHLPALPGSTADPEVSTLSKKSNE